MTELEQLTALCERLGAPHAQAQTMAAQLLKRAGSRARRRWRICCSSWCRAGREKCRRNSSPRRLRERKFFVKYRRRRDGNRFAFDRRGREPFARRKTTP